MRRTLAVSPVQRTLQASDERRRVQSSPGRAVGSCGLLASATSMGQEGGRWCGCCCCRAQEGTTGQRLGLAPGIPLSAPPALAIAEIDSAPPPRPCRTTSSRLPVATGGSGEGGPRRKVEGGR